MFYCAGRKGSFSRHQRCTAVQEKAARLIKPCSACIFDPDLHNNAGGERCSARHQRESRPSRAGNRMRLAHEWAPIHNGVQCDRCGVCPIQGPRYNSQVGEIT